MGFCKDGNHQPRRMRLNDWDDVTQCARSGCGHWIQVHHNVRGSNPNFSQGKRKGG
jgi:hypothetical protein